MTSHPGTLVGRWVRSWEEDAGDVQAYRPEGFDFPLSRRPRTVLELQADGRVLSRIGGPADTLVGRDGHWTADDPAHLTLRWDAADDAAAAETVGPVDAETVDGETVDVEIVERREDLLRLRPLRGAID